MWCIYKYLSATAFVCLLMFGPSPAEAQSENRDATAMQRGLDEYTRLRAQLAKVNADVAELKRASRSVRNDYRLRERMADAEALAQKVTKAEARLRSLGWTDSQANADGPLVVPPQVSPQDGIVELEAKAGLFADQARKLDGEADVLAKAAEQIRNRKALRRRAGAWDRDPFAGLEASKRNLAISGSTPKVAVGGSPTAENPQRGGTGSTSSNSPSTPLSPTSNEAGGGTPGPFVVAAPAGPPTRSPSEAATKDSTSSLPSEAAAASKTSPMAQSLSTDRQSFEQRLYLDPATAAELRQALGATGATSDPEALERAAAALRARAHTLKAQAQALLAKSRAP
jgi:hypothetical protein